MTQGDGSNTKAQTCCPDQYRHIDDIGHIHLWYDVMKPNRERSYKKESKVSRVVYLYASQEQDSRLQSYLFPYFSQI